MKVAKLAWRLFKADPEPLEWYYGGILASTLMLIVLTIDGLKLPTLAAVLGLIAFWCLVVIYVGRVFANYARSRRSHAEKNA